LTRHTTVVQLRHVSASLSLQFKHRSLTVPFGFGEGWACVMAFIATGELTEVMSLPVVLPTILTLIGLGLLVVYAMRDRLDANWAKVFFVTAAAYWVAKVIMWGIKTSHGFGFRFVAAFAATGLAGAFVIEAWRLVSQKHNQQQPSTNQPQPNSSLLSPSPSPSPVETKKGHQSEGKQSSAKQQPAEPGINQTMTNSPGGVQAGHDITIGQKPSPAATEKDKKP